jgi:hypothetical protein
MNTNTKLVFFLICLFSLLSPVGAQSAKTVTAKFGSTPIIDGVVSDSEWSDASSITFSTVQVFVKQDGVNLFVAFKSPLYQEIAMAVFIDENNDKTSFIQTDDIGFSIRNDNSAYAVNLATKDNLYGLTARYSDSGISQAEFKIDYSLLGLVAGKEKVMGIDFAVSYRDTDNEVKFIYWTSETNYTDSNPSEWGTINSVGYNWIPEFPSTSALLLLALASIPLVYLSRSNSKTKRARGNLQSTIVRLDLLYSK